MLRPQLIRTSLAIAAFSITVAWSGAARADEMDPKDEAHALFDQGREHFSLAEFEKALEAFTAGYKLDPNPAFLFRMGRCHEELHDATKARFLYNRYLDEAPDGPLVDDVEDALERLEGATDRRGDPDDRHGDDDYYDGDDDDDDDDDYGDDDYGDDDDDGYYDDGSSGRGDAGGPDPTALKVWKSLRTVGMVVTFVGIGIGAISTGFFIRGATRTMGSDDDDYLFGWVTLSTGVSIALVFGMPLWILSAVSVGGVKRRVRSAVAPGHLTLAPGITLMPYAAPLPGGGGMGGFHLTF